MPTPSGATVVVGTAGHIDHGKTTLLRALTGIDADRLPEERERGMTIDVGFAHLDVGDGTAIDFVDVPGHDRLVGNMLVGAGEIDAVLLVVAADDGPRAQTLEHLELLDALGLRHAVVAVTKVDAVAPERTAEVAGSVRRLVDSSAMASAPIVEVSSVTGAGLGELRHALVELRDAVRDDAARRPAGPLRMPIDRAFTVRGRGLVVTGTLRGGPVTTGAVLHLLPGGEEARVREVQVHHGRAERADGGRTGLNLTGLGRAATRRGFVLTAGRGLEVSDRALVALHPPNGLTGRDGLRVAWPPRSALRARFHLWTGTVDAALGPIGSRFEAIGPGGSDDAAGEPSAGGPAMRPRVVAAILRLAEPAALMPGARGVLRDPGSSRAVAGVTVLDARPPRGRSRRRMSAARVASLASAIATAAARSSRGAVQAVLDASLELQGWLSPDRVTGIVAALSSDDAASRGGRALVAPDVEEAMRLTALEAAAAGSTLADARAALARHFHGLVTVERSVAATAAATISAILDDLIASGRVARDGDRLRLPGDATGTAAAQEWADALARLEAALDVDVPPSLAEAARVARCPLDGVVALERAGRIVRVEDDLAWATPRYLSLRDRAVAMARLGPLAPAAFRDAIGANRRVVMPLLEDFDRKGFLRRTEAGHLPGSRA